MVLKTEPSAKLVDAIRLVHRGQLWLDYEIASQLISQSRIAPMLSHNEVGAETASPLTAREQELITLLCEGLNDQEVADRAGISIATVRTHLASIYLKLGIKDRLKLVIYSYRHGLAQIPPPSPNGGMDFGEGGVRNEGRAKLYVAHRKLA